MSQKFKFPSGFLFGSSTSAHQIEGGQINDWSRWEKIPGNIDGGDSSEIAADSFVKWPEDIELLKKTHQNAYRFSVEWSRIEPTKGSFDQGALDHYREILLALRQAEIKSMLTLFHFTLPQWLDDEGGMRSSKFPFYFQRFARKIAQSHRDNVDFYVTFNEPNVYLLTGFIVGNWYPARKNDFLGAYKVYRNFVKAHGLAYKAIKKSSRSPVGPVVNVTCFRPKKNTFVYKTIVKFLKYFDWVIFIKPIISSCDFIGINYYSLKYFPADKLIAPIKKSLARYVQADSQVALAEVLEEQKKWGKPIYITENGLPDDQDLYRADFIRRAFAAMHSALGKGVDLRGYFHWSLIDNFEWASGYSMKFGLATIERNLRPSALEYKKLIDEYRG